MLTGYINSRTDTKVSGHTLLSASPLFLSFHTLMFSKGQFPLPTYSVRTHFVGSKSRRTVCNLGKWLSDCLWSVMNSPFSYLAHPNSPSSLCVLSFVQSVTEDSCLSFSLPYSRWKNSEVVPLRLMMVVSQLCVGCGHFAILTPFWSQWIFYVTLLFWLRWCTFSFAVLHIYTEWCLFWMSWK